MCLRSGIVRLASIFRRRLPVTYCSFFLSKENTCRGAVAAEVRRLSAEASKENRACVSDYELTLRFSHAARLLLIRLASEMS